MTMPVVRQRAQGKDAKPGEVQRGGRSRRRHPEPVAGETPTSLDLDRYASTAASDILSKAP